jgi:mRNA-degrading endonuclease RelE of RelBE toxin-antitoxin system
VRDALRVLTRDPVGREKLLDVRQLDLDRAKEPVYRVRVGDWRVVYILRGQDILVLKVFHRSDGYRWLDTFGL